MNHGAKKWHSWRGVVVLWLVFTAVYAQSLSFEFVFDDISALRDNPAMDLPLSESLKYTQHQHHRSITSKVRLASHDSYRPLQHLSLRLDHAIAPGNAAVFHLHNVLSGGIALWLAWIFLGLWLRHPIARLTGTALFALHPIQVETVAYISGRSDLEAGICALLMLIAGTHAIRVNSPRKTFAWAALAVFAYFASLAQKEAFALAPFLLLFSPDRAGLPQRKQWAFVGLCVSALVGWFALRNHLIDGVAPLDIKGALANAGKGLRQGIMGTLVPLGSSPVRPFAEGPDWLDTSLFALAGLGSLTAVFLARDPRHRAIGFGMVWYCLLLGPATAAAYLFGVFSDHYLFLPSLGLFLMFVALGELIGARLKRPARVALACFAGLVSLWWVTLTVTRIPAWKSPHTLAKFCTEQNPEAGRGWVWLADAEIEGGDCTGVVKYYEIAVSVEPDYAVAWSNLSTCALRAGHFEQARNYAQTSLQKGGETSPSAWHNYAIALEQLGRTQGACKAYRSVLLLNPLHEQATLGASRTCSTE